MAQDTSNDVSWALLLITRHSRVAKVAIHRRRRFRLCCHGGVWSLSRQQSLVARE
jgi:hypothetical protein